MSTKRPQLPPAVRAGDRVGVAALSGPVDGERLGAGLAELERLGFEVVTARNLGQRAGMFAGDEDSRLEAFHELAADDSLTAIFFARGGYGVMPLLPRLDWQLLAEYPRAYVGYSDVTPFLLQVVERLGLVCFHGPMVAADLARRLTDDEARSLLEALSGAFPVLVACQPGCGPNGGSDTVEGPLLGGCLSLLAALAGTPFTPDLGGSLLFLEDIGEPLYRRHRMLTQLELSGSLRAVKGLLFGHFGDHLEHSSPAPNACEWRRLQASFAERLGISSVDGLPCGHDSPNLTLPLGLPASLDWRSGMLTVGSF